MIYRISTKKKNDLIYIQSILFIFLPFFLITGPFLSDLAVSLIAVFFLIDLIKKNNLKFLNNNLFKLFLFFWIYILLNSLFQNQNLDSLKISFFYIRFILFAFAIIYILENNNKILKHFFICLMICMCVLLVDGFFQFVTGKNFIGYKLADGPRVSSFFGDELILGSYLSRLLPIITGIFILIYMKKFNKNLFIYFLIFYLLIEILIFISGERTAFFYFVLSSVFILFLTDLLKKKRFVISFVAIFFIFLIISFSPNIKNRMLGLTLSELGIGSIKLLETPEEKSNSENLSTEKFGIEDLIKDLNVHKNLTLEKIQKAFDMGFITQIEKEGIEKDLAEQKKVIIFSSHHTEHYISAFRMFKDNIFFGVGVKNFRKKCKETKYRVAESSCSTHPHNSYIQLMSETGLIGLIYIFSLFFIFLSYIYRHLRKSEKNFFLSDFEICMLSGILITLWPLAPTGNIFNNWLNIIFHIPLGLFLWSKKNNIKKIKI